MSFPHRRKPSPGQGKSIGSGPVDAQVDVFLNVCFDGLPGRLVAANINNDLRAETDCQFNRSTQHTH
jgi:hypothetical protein